MNGGGGEGLILDTAGNLLSSRYRDRVSQHEAGHFLVSYLLGVLPRAYTLSSLNALTKYGALNLQAGTRFVDYDFQEEVKTGKLQSKVGSTFEAYLCYASKLLECFSVFCVHFLAGRCEYTGVSSPHRLCAQWIWESDALKISDRCVSVAILKKVGPPYCSSMRTVTVADRQSLFCCRR